MRRFKDPLDIFDPEAEEGRDGVMLWCPFNSRLNSSTRCELGAAITALLAPYPVNIGIDNATVVGEEMKSSITFEGRRLKNGTMVKEGRNWEERCRSSIGPLPTSSAGLR